MLAVRQLGALGGQASLDDVVGGACSGGLGHSGRGREESKRQQEALHFENVDVR